MLIKNKTVGVFHINNKPVLPNQTIEISEQDAKNPVIQRLIQREKFVEIKAEKPAKEVQNATADPVGEFDKLMAGEVTEAKLKAFAKKNKIDLGEAKTIEDMTTVIKACIALQ